MIRRARASFVHLVPAKPDNLLVGVKEQHIDLAGQTLTVEARRAQLAVDLQQTLFLILGGILLQGGQDGRPPSSPK